MEEIYDVKYLEILLVSRKKKLKEASNSPDKKRKIVNNKELMKNCTKKKK